MVFIQKKKKKHYKVIEKKNYDEYLTKSYFNDNSIRCNLLAGNEPDSNPYNRELTGFINPNKLVGWKAVRLAKIPIKNNSISISKLYSFDDTYNISIQDSIFEKKPYIIENNKQYSDN